jgi:glycosyltransferase involved in cell wall biosynthesis
MYSRLTHEELVKIIGACRIGLCTSRMESQHLAGIEMGACGLPMVAPPVGVYWKRDDMPGIVVSETTPQVYTTAIRATLDNTGDPEATRLYWMTDFCRSAVRRKWEALIKEVECSGQS